VKKYGYSVAEAAHALGVPESTLYEWIRAGEIAVLEYGKGRHRPRYIIEADVLEQFLQSPKFNRKPGKYDPVNGDGNGASDA
jgi:excisionase family DNA binding protein